MEVDRLTPPDDGLHPLAVILGVVGILVMIVVVAASSYQREKLQHMARKMLRKKRLSVSDDKQHDGAPIGTLPGFVKTAAESGNARVVKRWVNSTNRDIDSRSNENLTALHYAARGGHNECTRLLLDANADPNVQDERRITPLHLAALGGHALCVKLLVDHHADPFREDLDQQTPLSIAEKSGNVGCARLLQRAMAKAAVSEDSLLQDKSLTLRAGTSRLDNTV
ncbi:Ankyrin repeat-containing domain, partial [Globisporangium splendens]